MLRPVWACGHPPQASCQPPGRAHIPLTLLFLGRVMAVPATVIYFTAYDQLRDYLHARMGSRGHHIPLLAGALARREYPSSLGGPPVPPLRPLRRARRVSWLSVPTFGTWLCCHGALLGSGTATRGDRTDAQCPLLQWVP